MIANILKINVMFHSVANSKSRVLVAGVMDPRGMGGSLGLIEKI